ncbi:MAG TPA: glucose-6-phosphate dehydrogenase [Microbacterium sp.]|nr:glucose-6-phosphate dehydrogenase [Microbacterium sp.]
MTDDTTLVIFGATGDLTSRLLLPALGQLLTLDPARRVHLRGVAMDAHDDQQWHEIVRRAFASTGADAERAEGADAERALESVVSSAYRSADITKADDLASVLHDTVGRIVLYFAVPPAVAEAACAALADVPVPPGTIIALEKPFGVDEASAHSLNETLARIVPENQIFRVDHFLGRSTTLNLLGARFANRLLEPVWSAEHIDSVVIRYDETLGLEGRAGYYDRAGALVDMLQSHLLQVLAVLAMEPPATLSEIDLRDATSAALRATRIWDDDPVRSSRRARYTAGEVSGAAVPAYVDEPGVDPARGTETLAEITCEVSTSRWAGVPITLRSGKAIGARHTEIVIRFRAVRHLPAGFTGSAEGSVLRFTLGPDVMSLELNINGPGDPFGLERVALDADLGPGQLLAYGEVLSGILDGDASLAVRGDAAEQCWRIVQPVLDAWHAGTVPLDEYRAGTGGPAHWRHLPGSAVPHRRSSAAHGTPRGD